LATNIHFYAFALHTSSICWQAIEESQENIEILRRHKAHGRFSLLRKGKTVTTHTLKQRTKNHFSLSPSYRNVE